MRVLVAGEYSGTVRGAFERKGHDAISVDLLPTEIPGQHYQGDIFEFLAKDSNFDLMIAHPPCTYIANSSSQWFHHPLDTHLAEKDRRVHPKYPDRWRNQVKGLSFFIRLQELDIPKICIENPIPLKRCVKAIGKYDQIIQPYQFGAPFTKATCLWLKGLPLLQPLPESQWVPKHLRQDSCHKMSPGPDRGKERARFWPEVAFHMAQQWG